MRLTVGNKIFALAGGMTLIVAAAAMISAYFISTVNIEVHRVAETYISLADGIDKINDNDGAQEHLFQRILHRLKSGQEKAANNTQRQDFRAQNDVNRELFKTGLELLRQAQSDENFVDFKVELTRLSTLLQAVANAHGKLEVRNRAILDRLVKDHTADVGDLLTGRLEHELELARRIKNVTNEVKALTKRAALRAAKAEVLALKADVIVTIGALIFGLIIAGVIARGLVRPVHQLLVAVKEVEGGNLSPELQISSKDEIGDLAKAFESMTAELRIKEQIKDTFGKDVDPRGVEHLTSGEDAGLGDGERRVYSVFFSDIAGFTEISEQLTPTALVNLINAYLGEMSKPIQDSQGVIDKYIGDAIMAFWGPPFTAADNHAHAACRAALKQQILLAEFRETVGEITGLRRDFPDVSMRIGISTGEVLVGSIGSETARNYTVLGDSVNLAARLESLGKHYHVPMLICENTWAAVRDDFETREIDTIAVAGKTEAVRIFELLSPKGELTTDRARARDAFQDALASYRAGDWRPARDGLEQLQAQAADDGPVRVLLDRLDDLERSPPPDWDGIWRFSQK